MKFRHPSPAAVISGVALFAALGGTGYAATQVQTANNAKHLGSKPPSYYAPAKEIISSHGERFFSPSPDGSKRTIALGHVGHFIFSASCTKVNDDNQVTFDVRADTTADLDGNGPSAKGTLVNIHTNSPALDSTADHTIPAGSFDQVGSASSSTEIAADGQEADVFYNDGVNWPAGNGSQAHDCFAGYTGLLAAPHVS
jgi:hypothetical protein